MALMVHIQLVCSTLDVLSSDLVGPVCVIGTTRSVFNGAGGLRGAVMVKTPSDDNVDWTSFGFEPAVFGLYVMGGKEMEREREGKVSYENINISRFSSRKICIRNNTYGEVDNGV